MFGLSLFNPYVLLGLVLAFLGVAFVAHHEGAASDHIKTMAAWDHANTVATEARGKRIAANAATMKNNQKDVDNERKTQAATLERMRGNLVIALNGLRDRPNRPSEGHPGAGAVVAGAGPNLGCTGAELYRDDAVLLTWKADAAQRIRVQRDTCYRLYGKAQEAVSKLQCQ